MTLQQDENQPPEIQQPAPTTPYTLVRYMRQEATISAPSHLKGHALETYLKAHENKAFFGNDPEFSAAVTVQELEG